MTHKITLLTALPLAPLPALHAADGPAQKNDAKIIVTKPNAKAKKEQYETHPLPYHRPAVDTAGIHPCCRHPCQAEHSLLLRR
jgi:hypothetical protein